MLPIHFCTVPYICSHPGYAVIIIYGHMLTFCCDLCCISLFSCCTDNIGTTVGEVDKAATSYRAASDRLSIIFKQLCEISSPERLAEDNQELKKLLIEERDHLLEDKKFWNNKFLKKRLTHEASYTG